MVVGGQEESVEDGLSIHRSVRRARGARRARGVHVFIRSRVGIIVRGIHVVVRGARASIIIIIIIIIIRVARDIRDINLKLVFDGTDKGCHPASNHLVVTTDGPLLAMQVENVGVGGDAEEKHQNCGQTDVLTKGQLDDFGKVGKPDVGK